jgi:D-alanine-D-alanine ligase
MPAAARTLRVMHLVGSAVDDFHAGLSRLYAGACLEALAESAGHDAQVAYVSPDESWRFPSELSTRAIAQAPALSMAEAARHIGTLEVNVVIPQMFCIPGMTTYRALFDKLGIPYLGNRPEVMAVGADKVTTRAVVAAGGCRRADYPGFSGRGEARRRRQFGRGFARPQPGRV